MPRKSAAALTVARVGKIETYQRPQPPAELTDEQAAEWVSVVDRLPADWFPRETHALLVQYCRQIVRARRIGFLLDEAERAVPFHSEQYLELVRSEESVSKTIGTLATRMRVSQHSSYDKTQKRAIMPSKPWDKAA